MPNKRGMDARGRSFDVRVFESEAAPSAPVTPDAVKLAAAEKHIPHLLSSEFPRIFPESITLC
ncbi:MAG: hypothetical protein CL678_06775 [Bdellovibrionaceae bacterium]|nr:hypothetical protein [Pseudobdellovibrionaceae bacterium]